MNEVIQLADLGNTDHMTFNGNTVNHLKLNGQKIWSIQEQSPYMTVTSEETYELVCGCPHHISRDGGRTWEDLKTGESYFIHKDETIFIKGFVWGSEITKNWPPSWYRGTSVWAPQLDVDHGFLHIGGSFLGLVRWERYYGRDTLKYYEKDPYKDEYDFYLTKKQESSDYGFYVWVEELFYKCRAIKTIAPEFGVGLTEAQPIYSHLRFDNFGERATSSSRPCYYYDLPYLESCPVGPRFRSNNVMVNCPNVKVIYFIDVKRSDTGSCVTAYADGSPWPECLTDVYIAALYKGTANYLYQSLSHPENVTVHICATLPGYVDFADVLMSKSVPVKAVKYDFNPY